MSRIVTAKYSGFCGVCRTKYAKGDEIKQDAGGKWVHSECPPEALQAQASRRHDATYNEGSRVGGYNPHRKAGNEVLADELEKDGRVVVVGCGRRVVVKGLRAGTLTGSAAEVFWAREIRANEVRGVLADIAAKATTEDSLREALRGLAGLVQVVLDKPETVAAKWWIDRRPQRDDALGAVLREQVQAAFRANAAVHATIHVDVEG